MRAGRRDGTPRGIDERGVSIALTHALTVAITAVLLSGLIMASGTLVDTQQEWVGEQQLSEIGSDIVSQIATVDRLSATGEGVNTTVTPEYPDRIVETYSYRVELRESDAGDRAVVHVRSSRLGASATFDIETRVDVEPATILGSEVQISLCEGEYVTLGACDL